MRHRPHSSLAAAVVVLLIVLIGVADVGTGSSYHPSVFYIVPAVAAGWFVGPRFGALAGILAGVSWDVADAVIRADDLAASAWNALSRLAVLAAVGSLAGLLGISLERERQSRERLRETLARREEFLALLAHEVRAPVAAIETVATGLASTPTVGEGERSMLQRLLREARDLAALAEGVLAAGRLDAGVPQLELEAVDLVEIVAELAEDRPRVRHRGPGGPVVAIADRNALRRAIDNLVRNALEFSPAAEPVEIVLRHAEESTCIDVIDHGIGLEPEERAMLFRRYGRVRGAPGVSRSGGIGLGLYFARLIAEAHGGRVTVDSAGRGHGSTFTLCVPVTGAEPRLDPREGM